MPRTKNNKSKAKGQKVKLKTQEVLDPRDAPNIPVDPIDSHGTATASLPESGASFIPPSPILYRVPTAPALPTSICQPAGVWSDAHLLRTISPP